MGRFVPAAALLFRSGKFVYETFLLKVFRKNFRFTMNPRPDKFAVDLPGGKHRKPPGFTIDPTAPPAEFAIDSAEAGDGKIRHKSLSKGIRSHMTALSVYSKFKFCWNTNENPETFTSCKVSAHKRAILFGWLDAILHTYDSLSRPHEANH